MFSYACNKIQIDFRQPLCDEYLFHVNFGKNEAYELYKIFVIFKKVYDKYVFSIVFIVSAAKEIILFYLDKRVSQLEKVPSEIMPNTSSDRLFGYDFKLNV